MTHKLRISEAAVGRIFTILNHKYIEGDIPAELFAGTSVALHKYILDPGYFPTRSQKVDIVVWTELCMEIDRAAARSARARARAERQAANATPHQQSTVSKGDDKQTLSNQVIESEKKAPCAEKTASNVRLSSTDAVRGNATNDYFNVRHKNMFHKKRGQSGKSTHTVSIAEIRRSKRK